MDRQIIYPGAVPLETDLLNTNRNTMTAIAKLCAAIFGASGTVVNGLAVTQTGVASMQVQVAPGEIYQLANLDATAYSSLAADTTHQITKQGISLDNVLLSCAAPGTAGFSVNYLIEATFAESDTTPVVLPYYNASNPSTAYSGPANAGTTNNTKRQGIVTLVAMAGTAATTGTQTTPAPDSGYVGLAVVTVANGAASITNSNISAYFAAPVLPAGGLFNSAQMIAVAAGTADVITANFTPAATSMTNGLTYMVRANLANATTTPSFAPNGLTAKTIVKGNGLALAAGDIAGAGHWIELQYDLTLDKWVLQNPATGIASSTATVRGAFANLQASATGLSASVTVTADEIVLESAGNAYTTQRAVSLTIAGTSSGVANGLDTGALAASTWYSVWVIWNGTTQAGLLSLSATAPTLPSGYTHKARVGWIRTDASGNKFPISFVQFGKRVQYKVNSASNLVANPILAAGIQGSPTVPTWVNPAWANFAPPTTASLRLSLSCSTTGTQAMAAPNASYGVISSTTNPPPLAAGNASSAITYSNAVADIIPETANLYYASSASGAALSVLGWEDNI
jgi:hypothetical protein